MEMLKEYTLRFHHLLCLPLFIGEGYSDDFSANMQYVKKFVETEDPRLRFICKGDMICENCPNRRPGGCALDSTDSTVADKDRRVSEILRLVISDGVSYSKALQAAHSLIDKRSFEDLCGDCRWFRQGLCSYEKWEENAARTVYSLSHKTK